jgi:hypothetical protein
VDVVLERDRDPVQRPAQLALGALAVALVGLLERIGIDRDHGVQPVLVERDALQRLPHQLARCHAALLHRRAHLGDRRLDDAERRGGGGLGPALGLAGRQRGRAHRGEQYDSSSLHDARHSSI